MRKFLSIICILMLATAAFAIDNADVSPNLGPVAPKYESDVMWDLLQSLQVQTMTNNQLYLGAAFAGGYFWCTNGGASSAVTTDNRYVRFTQAGALVDSFPQPTNSGWGWRDLAFDGTYLYAGCEAAQVVAFNPTNGALVPTMNFPKPAAAAIVRALAYDPNTDHFWTGNFGSNIIEMDRSGNVIWQGSPAPLTAVYGMAWDDAPGGPWLWIFDQGTPGCVFRKFNPITRTLLAETHNVPLLPGLTSQIAGGAEMSSTYSGVFNVMVGMAQGTPNDVAFVLEMEPTGPPPTLDVVLTPINPPIVVPAQGGNFNFTAAVTNLGPSQVPFWAWARIKNPDGSYTAPTLGPININPPVGTQVSRQRTQSVPGTWPSGTYSYIGYAALSVGYPALDSSSFTWTKSATADGGPAVWEAVCSGELFPGEVLAQPATHSVLSNYPNPFNPSTTISFTLGNAGNVQLTVYDVNGREVTRLVNGYRAAGQHSVSFDGSNLASGVYLYTLSANGQTSTAKMMLVK